MTDREKLIELLCNAENSYMEAWSEWSEEQKKAVYKDGDGYGFYADHLIANGVTVQKWIPVTERLPEQPHKWDARGWYLVALKNGVVKELCYEFLESSVFGYGWRETAYPVTHWMPLPQPPRSTTD